jgi:predicted HNH restriction endonuclease
MPKLHHVDPTEKDFGLAQSGITKSWEKMKIELDKCILVCANCHREIHFELDKIDKDPIDRTQDDAVPA